MPAGLDLHDWTEGGRRQRPPTLQERIMARQAQVEIDRQRALTGQKLQGPVERAVTRAVKQTDFRRLMDDRIQGKAREYAQANPASLTGRLMREATVQTPEERLGQIGSGQFRGSEVAKRRARKQTRQFRYRGA